MAAGFLPLGHAPAGAQASAEQKSWAVIRGQPVEGAGSVVAWWHDEKGNRTDAPAIIQSKNGAWFSHIVIKDDAPAKGALLLGLAAQFVPELRQQACARRIALLGAGVCDNGWDEAVRQVEALPDLFGQGQVRREGRDVTVVAISHMVHEAFAAAEALAAEGIEAEVLDPRSLRPLDEDLILNSLAKTGRLVVADCGWKTGGVTAEIAALAVEKGFDLLKAPVRRVACPDLPTPAGYTLEAAFYPGQAEIMAAVREVLA